MTRPVRLLITLALLFVVVGALVIGVITYTRSTNAQSSAAYQAVFLTNNQVYFGHLTYTGDGKVVLKDVYYLQQQQDLQKKDAPAAPGQIALVKLGGELHAPQGDMVIPLTSVLFIEDLRPDSPVAGAIEAQKNSGK